MQIDKKKYKIVCVTPAGRRRYMKALIPQILSSSFIDRYDIWVNTTDQNDIQFFQKLGETFDKIRIIKHPEGKINGIKSINAFFTTATEPDTIYIRLDDDVVWIEPDFFKKIIEFRIANPHYFLVAPLIINNALCSHVLQSEKKLECSQYIRAEVFDAMGWKNGEFALNLHKWFVRKVNNNTYQDLYCGIKPIALNRFSINCIAWFGETFRKFNGIVLEDEEEFLTVTKPLELGMANCFYCNTIVAHFAFFSQRGNLDKTNILEEYLKIIDNTYAQNTDYSYNRNKIEEILETVNEYKYHESKKHPRNLIDKIKLRVYHLKVPVIKLASIGQLKSNLIDSKIKSES